MKRRRGLMQVSDKLIKPLTEAKYLNADNVSRYRCIMRIFFEHYEKLKYWLYQEEVYEEMIKDPFFADYRPEQCQQDLTMLTEWKNLNTIQDTKKVASIEEFKNKKYRYQMTEYSVEIERLVLRLENLFIEGASLEPTLLERIRRGIERFPEMVERDKNEVYTWWTDLNNDFVRLNQNYQDYIGAIARDRAEQARIDVEKARQDRWKAQQAAAEREYNWNTYKFETEQAAKAADSKRKAEENAAKQAEIERHNKATERISLMRIDNDSQKQNGKKNKYPSYRISGKKGFSGSTRAYNLNKNEDVALMYNDLEKTFGLEADKRPKSIKGMRDYILSIYGKQQKVESGEAFNPSSKPENKSWSLKGNNSWSLK